MNYPSELLKTERLEIKRKIPSMAEELFKLVDFNRDHLSRFMPWVDRMQTVEDEKEHIKTVEKNWNEHLIYDFVIFFEEEMVGSIGAHHIAPEHKQLEIGYWLSTSFEGKGIITEALLAFEKELFSLGYHRLEIRCFEENKRSQNIPLRNGYTLEGTLRDQVISRGKFINMKVYSKLSSDS